MPPGFHRLIAAQFASALSDNALLIVAIALLQQQGLPPWWAPLMKLSFTAAYVVLAPFVGPLADAIPKARLMACMNGVKVLGVLCLLAGMHPVAAFALVGIGAAAYAPAKYGLITELVAADRLVQANGWLEVSVVCAALFGAAAGGLLVSPWALDSAAFAAGRRLLEATPLVDSRALSVSLAALLMVYATAAWLNLGVPESGARYPPRRIHLASLLREFRQNNRTLWRDGDGRLSLTVTTVFWGVGATLQFAVLRWAGDVLHLPLDRSAYLQTAVAAGVIAGAAAAGRWIPLAAARRVLVAGIALGLLMAVVASTNRLAVALPLLVLVGAVGGLLVVPLNALLQHRGCQLLSAGRSIAVQGFNENASVLAMLAVYAALVAMDVSIVHLMWGFGGMIALAMARLTWLERCQPGSAGRAVPET